MSKSIEPGWHIQDPRPKAAAAPYTFFRPSEAELAAIQPGDTTKLIVAYDGPVEKWAAERMWVEVTNVDGDTLAGTLGNQPFEPMAPIKSGDAIGFCRHHVIDIQFSNPDAAPLPAGRREYWERCLVDQCVLDGEEPVEYLYREAPDMAQEGDTYPDSGWRIRGRRGEASDEAYDNRKAAYVALGAVLNKDDSWLHLIDMPEGCKFERRFETGAYLRHA